MRELGSARLATATASAKMLARHCAVIRGVVFLRGRLQCFKRCKGVAPGRVGRPSVMSTTWMGAGLRASGGLEHLPEVRRAVGHEAGQPPFDGVALVGARRVRRFLGPAYGPRREFAARHFVDVLGVVEEAVATPFGDLLVEPLGGVPSGGPLLRGTLEVVA